MKELRKNITRVLVVFILLFTILTGYFIYDVVIYSGRWINSAYNPRLREKRSSVIPGSIYDVTGLELAGSSYDKRTYISDDGIRKAVAHTIGDIYGFSPLGIETTQGAWLLGFNENFIKRLQRIMLSEQEHGSDITLTLDAKLNYAISDMIGDNRGAAVVLNYKTGEVLSMVSLPEFDLKDIDVSQKHGGADEKSLINRALQGRYNPGCIFKIVAAAAAMEHVDLSGRTFLCKGSYVTEEGTIECEKLHGEQTFEEAIANGCKSTIAQLMQEVGVSNIQKSAAKAGFDYQFLFSDIVMYESNVGLSSISSEFEIAQTAVGMGDVTVTPMHIAMLYGAVANGGKMMPLKLLKNIEGQDMSKRVDVLRKGFDYAVAEKLDEILHAENSKKIKGHTVCATTAQCIGKSEEYGGLSWFAGYIDDEELPYTLVIVAEDYNGTDAGFENMAYNIFKMIIEEGN